MYHRFLIHSSTDEHLGCFQHLAIVNSTAMQIAAHKFFGIDVSGFSPGAKGTGPCWLSLGLSAIVTGQCCLTFRELWYWKWKRAFGLFHSLKCQLEATDPAWVSLGLSLISHSSAPQLIPTLSPFMNCFPATPSLLPSL